MVYPLGSIPLVLDRPECLSVMTEKVFHYPGVPSYPTRITDP